MIKSLIKCGIVVFGFLSFSCDSVRPFLLSEADEIAMGDKFKAQIIADTVNYPPYRGDPKVSSYVDSLGHVIANAQTDWSSSDVAYTFTVVDVDTMINAFAVPGGHVFIYTGLLLAAGNEAQVAGVIAHEVAHIAKHHSADILIKQNTASFISDLLIADSTSLAGLLAPLFTNLTFLKFSRNNEDEADKKSVEYTTNAGMNPQGMSEFLDILGGDNDDSPKLLEPVVGSVESLLSTHPKISDRIKNVNAIIAETSSSSVTRDKGETKYLAIRSLLN